MFAPGKWVGVELDEPKGKNNGVVQGKTYFQARENYGLFVRHNQLLVSKDMILYVYNRALSCDIKITICHVEVAPKMGVVTNFSHYYVGFCYKLGDLLHSFAKA